MASTSLPNITAVPTAGQHITHNGRTYNTIKEGLAHILVPAEASTTPQTKSHGENEPQSVFYNPIQQFNRDLSVLAIRAYGEETVERKRKNLEKDKLRFASRRRERKRKREADGLSCEPSCKAGKLEEANGDPVVNTNSTDIAEALSADTRELGVGEYKAGGGDVAVQSPSKSLHEQLHLDGSRISSGAQTETANVQPLSAEQNSSIATKLLPVTFTILDALSATGLRALRYVQEIPCTTSVTANDLLPTATKTININVKHNKLEGKIQVVTGNALTHMYSVLGDSCKDENGRSVPSRKYDVIDLDPYGTAAPFLDAAVQSVRDDGGLLCVTCTDAGVWASNGYPEKAYSLYGGIGIKGAHSHEGGLRLILHAIATSAARYGLAIEPLLSLSIDFYARVFVRIYKSAADVKFLAGKTMVVYNCDHGCGAWTTQMLAKNKLAPNKSQNGYFWKHTLNIAPVVGENCNHCGMKSHMAGPMYAGPLHSATFIKRILGELPGVSKETYQTVDRIEGMLTVALEEMLPPLDDDTDSPTLPSKTGRYDPATIDHFPFFFVPSVLSKVIHCVTPEEKALRGALRHLGYRVTRSHAKPGSIKTDASWEVIWEVMREWARQKAPIRDGAIREGTPGFAIMGYGKSKNNAKIQRNGMTTKRNDAEQDVSMEAESTDPGRLEVVFDEELGHKKSEKKLVRYQLNPRENWGPMNRATGHKAI